MKITKLLTTLLALLTISLFLTACDQTQPNEITTLKQKPDVQKPDIQTDALTESDNNYWARENLDLQAVGNLLEKADSAEEFENLLNSDDGINNLDLNGDGYVDYISVAEYNDRPDNRRGFSLFSRFDANDIQEIATIIFDRDRPNQRGSRVYLNGNEQIYGDNNFYEGDWLDKGLNIASWVFSDRNDYYRSPYYYDNYPDNYNTYSVVETPVYRERVAGYIVDPTFYRVKTQNTKINLRSPYEGRTFDRIYARLANPTEQQRVFIKNNPKPPEFKERKDLVKADKADKDFEKAKNKNDKFEDKRERKEDKEDRKADKREAKEDRKIDKKEAKENKREIKREKADKGGKGNNIQKADKGNGKGKNKGKN
ncbi:MAG: hypothetical protein ACR2J3_00030 [Aridibacter sp.]